tara:strand:+ start:209 stop:919 length:711 start_codon:yes stop_codon:yes gene_type:complete
MSTPRSNRRDIWMQTGSTSDTWLISFTDVIALMLTFFVLIFSMINPEREILSNVPFVVTQNTSTYDLTQAGNAVDPAGQRLSAMPGENLDYLASILSANLSERPNLDTVRVVRTDDRLTLSLPQSLLFASGDFRVQPQTRADLVDMIALFNNLKNAIHIVGYTDPEPVRRPTADYQGNAGLGLLRAQSVATILKDAGYKGPLQLYTVQIPAKAGQNYANLRRVEIVIHKNRPVEDF